MYSGQGLVLVATRRHDYSTNATAVPTTLALGHKWHRAIVDATGAHFAGVVAQLNVWSAMYIEAGAFPSDPFKRAAD